MKKTILLLSFGLLLQMALLLAANSAEKPTPAQVNPDFLEFIEKVKRGEYLLFSSDGKPNDCHPSPVDLSHVKGVINKDALTSYPTQYDLRQKNKVTSVRDQGDCGSSWAFASFASLESCLMPSEQRNFSEKNLLDNHGFDYDECDGGHAWMTAAYLARWDGPLNESDDTYPYTSYKITGDTPQKHVQQIIFLPYRSGYLDNDNIKYVISNYGAVYCTFRQDFLYYNYSDYSYYYNGSESTNHKAAIVGWDDNYSKSKFNTTPPGSGAFIVKDSWGIDWGENRYIYISYYDTSLTGFVCFNNAESTNNYEKIYQYDPLGWTTDYGYKNSKTAWGANVFNADENESLEAVSFYATDGNVEYEIYIYKNLIGSTPTDGELSTTKKGSVSYPGYYTVKLNSTVSLSSGEEFSVVIKFKNSSYNYPVAVEKPFSDYSSNANASLGESFMSSNGSNWYDMDTDSQNMNVCIKAFTNSTGGGGLLDKTPFGSFDTPLAGSTVRSSIAVTGWALDDTEVESVKIFRQEGASLVYIGDAIFVEGARPDVAQAYPDYPNNTRAGWGYMLLTYFLPNGGNGTFTLHAIARDNSGHEVTLGTKKIKCDNAHATKPFGAIDTPKPGETVSGNCKVQGWALTPPPPKIPVDGSTMRIRVDGKDIGHAVYNCYRSDIAKFFPGYANSNGAGAYFDLDTSKYSDGLHTIDWLVTDNAGNIDGVGSRFFTIENNGGGGETITIRTYIEDPDNPAGAGVTIKLDGVTVGVTSNDGTLDIVTNKSKFNLKAYIPFYVGANLTIDKSELTNSTVDIIMDSEGLIEKVDIVSSQVKNNVLPVDFEKFEMQLYDENGKKVGITEIHDIYIDLGEDGTATESIDALFSLAKDGSIIAEKKEQLRAILQSHVGLVEMVILGVNTDEESSYRGIASFYVGKYNIEGSLIAPPSNPNLKLSNIPIAAKQLNYELTFETISDIQGNFTFEKMPAGNYEFQISTMENGVLYSATAHLNLSKDTQVNITLLSAMDSVDGVTGITEYSLSKDSDNFNEPGSPRIKRSPDIGKISKGSYLTAQINNGCQEIFVSSGNQNVMYQNSKVYNVSKGTKKVILKYMVYTAEYPYYVLSRSEYDDVWMVKLQTGSQSLFSISRSVNSQVSVEPVWHTDGSTGIIQEKYDVSNLTVNADLKLFLTIGAKNVGDSLLDTEVAACVSLDDQKQIDILEIKGYPTVNTIKNIKTVVSVPNQAKNFYPFRFELTIDNKSLLKITKDDVVVSLLDLSGGLILNNPEINVEIRNSAQKIVTLIVDTNYSSKDFKPIASDKIRYQFTVTAVDSDGLSFTDTDESKVLTAMCRMPQNIDRYSYRDKGGDDWCRRSLYNWLNANSQKITKINDISGEHGFDIGHTSTHEAGLDMDIFHFTTLGNADSGHQNFNNFRNYVIDALNSKSSTRESSLKTVKQFILAERQGLSTLAADYMVQKILMFLGEENGESKAESRLYYGWARDLLKNGTTTNLDGKVLDLGIGKWNPSGKIKPATGHDHHHHVEFVN